MRQVHEAYGMMAAEYIERFSRTDQGHPDDLDLIVRRLSIQPGVVLDVGCGPGHYTAHLRALGVDAIGLDMVPAFIDHARAADPRGRYQLASMYQLPYPDRSVAGILAWYSLIHLPPDDVFGVLAELRRVMVPEGTVVVGFFEGDDLRPFAHKVVTAHYWPVDEFAARLQAAGFTEVERQQRAGVDEAGQRAHAAIVAAAV